MPARIAHAISKVSELLDLVRREKLKEEKAGNDSDFLFRGQPTDEPLVPKLGREQPRGSLPKVEGLILDEFKRTIPPLAEFQPTNDWEMLALAQHHGLHTRLLDWSYSTLAALWFTVMRPPEKNRKGTPRDGVLWILRPQIKDFINLPTKETPFDGRRTRILRPRVIARRIAAQAGLFTVHKLLDGNRFVPLEKNVNFSSKLIKVPVPAKHFSEIRKELNACGINHLALFPDLDGLGRQLNWRYFWYEDEG